MTKWHFLAVLLATLTGIFSVFFVKRRSSADVNPDPTEPDPLPELPSAPETTVSHPDEPAVVIPAPAPSQPVITPSQSPMDFSTPKAAYHSVRVICDEMGLPLIKNVTVNGVTHYPKDIICACIWQESRFSNKAVGRNAHSVDWGIVQINDRIWAGPGEPFSSAQDIVDHPEKAVRFMVHMYQKGKLSLWVSYSSGVYKQWLVHNSPMWGLAK